MKEYCITNGSGDYVKMWNRHFSVVEMTNRYSEAYKTKFLFRAQFLVFMMNANGFDLSIRCYPEGFGV